MLPEYILSAHSAHRENINTAPWQALVSPFAGGADAALAKFGDFERAHQELLARQNELNRLQGLLGLQAHTSVLLLTRYPDSYIELMPPVDCAVERPVQLLPVVASEPQPLLENEALRPVYPLALEGQPRLRLFDARLGQQEFAPQRLVSVFYRHAGKLYQVRFTLVALDDPHRATTYELLTATPLPAYLQPMVDAAFELEPAILPTTSHYQPDPHSSFHPMDYEE